MKIIEKLLFIVGLIGGAIWGYKKLNGNHYGEDGYNRYGYDQDGYDKDGYDKDGYNKDGYNQKGYNRKGLDINGYDVNGYNDKGYSINGLDKEGYDLLGYNRYGYDRDLNNREYYQKELKSVVDYIENHYDQQIVYRYRMLDCRRAIEKMTTFIIRHFKGSEILKDRDNQSLCKYIDIINEYNLLDLNDYEKKSIILTKNYCNKYLHEDENEIIEYKDDKVIETIKMLYSKSCKKLDIQKVA